MSLGDPDIDKERFSPNLARDGDRKDVSHYKVGGGMDRDKACSENEDLTRRGR